MPLGMHVAAGQVALIEPEDLGPPGGRRARPLTGAVEEGAGDVLTIVGVAPVQLIDGVEVLVSVFSHDALYRIRGGVRWLSSERLTIDPIHDVERIQRRRWPRHELHLDVALVPQAAGRTDLLAPGAKKVPGRTRDIGMGGLRVETAEPLAPATSVTVILMLPDGAPLVARASVVAASAEDGCYSYRLAFDQLDDVDTANLAALLDPQAAAADIRRKAAAGPTRSP